MTNKRVLVCCQDRRSWAALSREFAAHLYISMSQIDYAPTADEALTAMERGEMAVLVIVSEEESDKERFALEQLALAADCPAVFVNLRPNFYVGASLYAPACTVYLGPETRVDQVRKAIRRFFAGDKKKAGGGWR